jgi:hypothetical protein
MDIFKYVNDQSNRLAAGLTAQVLVSPTAKTAAEFYLDYVRPALPALGVAMFLHEDIIHFAELQTKIMEYSVQLIELEDRLHDMVREAADQTADLLSSPEAAEPSPEELQWLKDAQLDQDRREEAQLLADQQVAAALALEIANDNILREAQQDEQAKQVADDELRRTQLQQAEETQRAAEQAQQAAEQQALEEKAEREQADALVKVDEEEAARQAAAQKEAERQEAERLAEERRQEIERAREAAERALAAQRAGRAAHDREL